MPPTDDYRYSRDADPQTRREEVAYEFPLEHSKEEHEALVGNGGGCVSTTTTP